MLNCQACQTRLVLYSAQIEQPLQQLEDYLLEDDDNIFPPHLKAHFLIKKQTREINPNVFTLAYTNNINSNTTTTNNTNNSTTNPNINIDSSTKSTQSSQSTPTQQSPNSNQPNDKTNPTTTTLIPPKPNSPYIIHSTSLETLGPLIPDDFSLSFPIIEQRIHKMSQLLAMLTNLSLVHHPLCPKCSHEINVKLGKYCEKLEVDLSEMVHVQNVLLEQINIPTLKDMTSNHNSNQLTLSTSPKQQKNQLQVSTTTTNMNNPLEEQLNQQLLSLFHDEQLLRDEMEQLDQELLLLQQEEEELYQYKRYLHDLETNFMSTFLDMKHGIQQYLTLTRTLKSKLDQSQTIHNTLSLTSPLFDLIAIDLNSPIPSISGFRLGRNDDYQVDWFEINAGFGQICLLLTILKKIFNLTTFTHQSQMNTNPTIIDIQLYPAGYRSHIALDGKLYPMYKESHDSVQAVRFTQSCKILLLCIQQLYESQLLYLTPIPSAIINTTATPQSISSTTINTPATPTDIQSSSSSTTTTTTPTNNNDSIDMNNNDSSSPSSQIQKTTNISSTRAATRQQQQQKDSAYQPHTYYIHHPPIDENNINNNNNNNNNSKPVIQQPQYNTALYVQQIAKAGLSVTHMMSNQIQPPIIQLYDPNINYQSNSYNNNTNSNYLSTSRPTNNTTTNPNQQQQLPHISQLILTSFHPTINGCVLDFEDQGGWVNAMRQILMALFQLILIAAQRGV